MTSTENKILFRKIAFTFLSLLALGFYSWKILILLLVFYGLSYAITRVAHKFPNQKKYIVPIAILIIAVLFFGVRGLNSQGHLSPDFIAAFVGFSFLVFRLIHILFEIWRGLMDRPSALDLIFYLSFFPTYLAGPVELWKPFFKSLEEKHTVIFYKKSLWRICWSIPMKILFVDHVIVGKWLVKATTLMETKPGLAAVLTFGLVNYLRAYFDLMAYSNIAIGVCGLLGIRMRENLNKPWARTNIGEFWRSWHMSVTNWCTYHVYLPIFGQWRNTILATASSMMVMAFWHGTTINWILWGAHHTIGLIVYGLISRRLRNWNRTLGKTEKRIYTGVCWCLTQLYVVFGYFYVGSGIDLLFKSGG